VIARESSLLLVENNNISDPGTGLLVSNFWTTHLLKERATQTSQVKGSGIYRNPSPHLSSTRSRATSQAHSKSALLFAFRFSVALCLEKGGGRKLGARADPVVQWKGQASLSRSGKPEPGERAQRKII
jgi:hypothetical protein